MVRGVEVAAISRDERARRETRPADAGLSLMGLNIRYVTDIQAL
jgi:hypothetical protein